MSAALDISCERNNFSCCQRHHDLLVDFCEWFYIDVHSSAAGQTHCPGTLVCHTIMQMPRATAREHLLRFFEDDPFQTTAAYRSDHLSRGSDGQPGARGSGGGTFGPDYSCQRYTFAALNPLLQC